MTSLPTALASRLTALLPLHWLAEPICPLCAGSPAGCGCLQLAELVEGGVSGAQPLPWWAAGSYAGGLRRRILQLRRRPRAEALSWLAARAICGLPRFRRAPLLLPIPSWKRRAANPLPPLLAQAAARQLASRCWHGLERSRPVLGQHHLNRSLRLANQRDAFRALPSPPGLRRQPLLLVDDILTTGATACQAAATLTQAGWQVVGVLCLARTPAHDRP